jgi:Putative Actinobacterial Holin-X, holin superfamily III
MNLTQIPPTVPSTGEREREALREQPLGELVSRLSGDAALLARQEIALAKQELTDKVDVIKAEALGVGSGVMLAHTAILTLVAAIVIALAQSLPAWAAALVTGVALLAASAVLLLRAKTRLSRLELLPRAAVENVGRDVSAVREAAE